VNTTLIVAGVWVVALLIGVISWEKKRGRVRVTDIVVFAISIIAGAIWFFTLMPKAEATTPVSTEAATTRRATGTCAVIVAGDTNTKVKERLGEPDEIRSEAELRGPNSEVWIYRGSRCAIHFLGGIVESIE
jgi:hypothetical protein